MDDMTEEDVLGNLMRLIQPDAFTRQDVSAKRSSLQALFQELKEAFERKAAAAGVLALGAQGSKKRTRRLPERFTEGEPGTARRKRGPAAKGPSHEQQQQHKKAGVEEEEKTPGVVEEEEEEEEEPKTAKVGVLDLLCVRHHMAHSWFVHLCLQLGAPWEEIDATISKLMPRRMEEEKRQVLRNFIADAILQHRPKGDDAAVSDELGLHFSVNSMRIMT
jgi:hypothetical protein